MLNFSPFPNLFTERLKLRRLALDDLTDLHAIRSNFDVNRYLDRAKEPELGDTLKFINHINAVIDDNKSIYWVLCLKDEPRLLGTICYWNISAEDKYAEIGFELHPHYQGKGLMNEAIKVVLQYGREVCRFEKIVAETHSANSASVRLLERNHFVETSLSDGEHQEKPTLIGYRYQL